MTSNAGKSFAYEDASFILDNLTCHVMCSILGYKGNNNAASILVEGLRLMEYRGYDSAGIATLEDNKFTIRKGVGKVQEVNERFNLDKMVGKIGIGHTRWATHGGVTDRNAHPHPTCRQEIAVVHNGIISNYRELREELTKRGHIFKSETDSEVIAHLLEEGYVKGNDIKSNLFRTCDSLAGSYAFVAAFHDGTIAAARWEEPLIIGIADDEYFISSDVLGFLKHTDKAVFLDNGDTAILSADNELEIFDSAGNPISRPVTRVSWELGLADKGVHAHYTLKEINEQTTTLFKAADAGNDRLKTFCEIISNAKNVYMTGSGSSYHAALEAKHFFSKLAKIRTDVIISSEFSYEADAIQPGSVLIAISQSGESADVLHSVKKAKESGCTVLSIVNISTSSLARASEMYLELGCGPEIGVAATKSFTSQVALLYTIASMLGRRESELVVTRKTLQEAVAKVLSKCDLVADFAKNIAKFNDIYLLGRAVHYPIALEGALKLKELAYVHAEGLAAGELKHGPLALIDSNAIVIVLNPRDGTYEDTLSSLHEIKSRGATVMGISNVRDETYDYWIELPQMDDNIYPMLEVIPLQMLSYYLALQNKVNPDYPRNLAKSVTVR